MILARQCYDGKPPPWHVWEIICWQRYLCTGA